ncbi:MAG: hypothetical protein K6F39_00780 [Lachnospiraceae bacterium]|nr:hypothetical protein [Lachnospiraceae bacterium]
MAVNPIKMMQLAKRFNIFKDQHPKAVSFIQSIAASGFPEGTIIEMKVIDPQGNESIGNIKVTKEDLETVSILKDLNN